MDADTDRIKVMVFLKNSDKYVAYFADGTKDDVQDRWMNLLNSDGGSISFGNFVVPRSEILYVNVIPNPLKGFN